MLSLAILSILGIGSLAGFADSAQAQQEDGNQNSITVQVANNTYFLFYQMANGGKIDSISNEPYLTMVMNVTSPSNGTIQLRFSRELYDALTFTEHNDPLAVLDGVLVDEPVVIDSSCEETSLTIPVQAGTGEVQLIFSDTLNVHTHSYPEKIDLFKTIEEEGQEFSIRLVTDAKKCDVSFVKEEKKILIEIQGRNEVSTPDKGYFRLTVPHDLLGGNYEVLVDGNPTSFIEHQFFTKNNTDIGVESAIQDDFTPIKASHLSFNYTKDVSRIEVLGTTNSVIADYFCMMRVCALEMQKGNVTHVINYRMTGTISNVTADIESKSLILDVEAGRGGIRIALPKELIRAEDEQGRNDSYVVIVNGKETVFEEITEAEQYYSYLDVNLNPDEYRLLSITFENEVEQIEIVGTWVAPEFGSIAVLFMAVAITGMLVWSKWSTGRIRF